jgi:ribosomal protein S18 acetylase RimI-like enzyme
MEAGAEIRPFRPADEAACEAILRGLPDWFGIEESLVQYVRDLSTCETFLAWRGETVLGFLALREHVPWSGEIHVIAVRKDEHRHGIGRILVEEAERRLRERRFEYLQVKTLGPSRPDASYDKTRAFYMARGFRPLEETALWGEANPCLIMVKRL